MPKLRFWPCLLLLLLGACVLRMEQRPTAFTPLPEGPRWQLSKEVVLEYSNHTQGLLKAGTRWQMVGQVAEGEVYKPLDQVLTVQARQMEEAYLVVSQGRLVGFYLPVGKGFVAAKQPMVLPTQPVAAP